MSHATSFSFKNDWKIIFCHLSIFFKPHILFTKYAINTFQIHGKKIKETSKSLKNSFILVGFWIDCVVLLYAVKPNGFRKLFLLIHMSKPDNDCISKIAQIIDEIFTIHVHPYSRRITSNIFWAHFHKENPSF